MPNRTRKGLFRQWTVLARPQAGPGPDCCSDAPGPRDHRARQWATTCLSFFECVPAPRPASRTWPRPGPRQRGAPGALVTVSRPQTGFTVLAASRSRSGDSSPDTNGDTSPTWGLVGSAHIVSRPKPASRPWLRPGPWQKGARPQIQTGTCPCLYPGARRETQKERRLLDESSFSAKFCTSAKLCTRHDII